MKRLLLMLFFVLGIFAVSLSQTKMQFNDTITVTGNLQLINYKDEFDEGRFYMLVLDKKISVSADPADETTQDVENQKEIQVVFKPNAFAYAKKYLNKKIKLSGNLMYGFTRHHHRDILLMDATKISGK